MIIIGITGTIGAGKGAIVEYLVKKKGFTHYSMRQFLTDELQKRGLPLLRENMFEIANEFRKTHGPGYLVERFLSEAVAKGDNAVIESIRSVGEIEKLKAEPNSVLVAVDSDIKTRYQRILKRKSSTDMISFEKFVEDEQKESVSNEPWSQNLNKCRELADHVIDNNKSLNDLYVQIDKILNL